MPAFLSLISSILPLNETSPAADIASYKLAPWLIVKLPKFLTLPLTKTFIVDGVKLLLLTVLSWSNKVISVLPTIISSPSLKIIFWDWSPFSNKEIRLISVFIFPPPAIMGLSLITTIFFKSAFVVIPSPFCMRSNNFEEYKFDLKQLNHFCLNFPVHTLI